MARPVSDPCRPGQDDPARQQLASQRSDPCLPAWRGLEILEYGPVPWKYGSFVNILEIVFKSPWPGIDYVLETF